MIISFYPQKDATIYEKYVNKNTGLDAILDISKVSEGTTRYNSRALIKFDLVTLAQYSSSGLITSASDAKYYLKLYATEPEEIPVDYTLECYAISQSWNMGTGRYANTPETTDGVTWKYRTTVSATGLKWTTASYAPTTTGSYATIPGGGTWFTGSVATQSFNYSTADVEFDVTTIVKDWLASTIENQGFIIKKTDVSEQDTNTFKSLKFFSRDSHTIWIPRLEVRFNDYQYTASFTNTSIDTENYINISNIKDAYNEKSRVTFRVNARPRFPQISFQTSSLFLNNYLIPSESQYSIVKADTKDVIVPFDTSFTKISADNLGNYFKYYLDGLQPEQYYKILIKVVDTAAGYEEIYDNDWIFKVNKQQ
jgi:hypothetical protein